MAQKASVRRQVLYAVQKLVNELIQLNETAYRQGITLRDSGMSDANAKTAVELTLDAGGPLTVITGATPFKISDNIGGILAGNITVLVNSVATTIDWTHLEES